MSLRTIVGQLKTPLREILRSHNVISSRCYAAIAHARSVLEGELETIRAAGTWKGERVITSSQGPHINVEGSRGGERWTHVPAKPFLVSGNALRPGFVT